MDLVTRLRYRSSTDVYPTDTALTLMSEAADMIIQLRGNLSLAEEGLANATQEIQRLQRALNFWLPGMPDRDLPPELETRLGDDIALLVGYDGEMEPEAEQRGWITLNAEPQTPPHAATHDGK